MLRISQKLPMYWLELADTLCVVGDNAKAVGGKGSNVGTA